MTSIKWLIEQIKNDHNEKCLTGLEWIKIFEQAKEMHKQEIINAVENGNYGNGKEYYNETFKKD